MHCTLTGAAISDRDRWPTYYRWLCETLERFYEVFSDRVKFLDATAYEPLLDYDFDSNSPLSLTADAGNP